MVIRGEAEFYLMATTIACYNTTLVLDIVDFLLWRLNCVWGYFIHRLECTWCRWQVQGLSVFIWRLMLTLYIDIFGMHNILYILADVYEVAL